MLLAERLLWLCSIPSPTGEEGPLADELTIVLGRERPDLSVRRHGNSLVVTVKPPNGNAHVVLAGHLDTVRSVQDGAVRMEGDRIYGCGASDMKAGLAVMLELAARPGQLGAGLSLVMYAGEEGPYASNELEQVLRDDPHLAGASLAVCLEPSDNQLQLGCTGTLHATVRFEGRSAHSARPWQGENAIHKAAPLLTELAASAPQWQELDGLKFATVTSATLASGGTGRNVVPALFELNVNHRFAPGTSIEQARERLLQLIGGSASVEMIDEAPSAMPHRGHPLVRALEASGVRAVAAKQAWTDVARFEQHGIAAVNFGPGVQAQAHQRNEWASERQMHEGMDVLRGWLARL